MATPGSLTSDTLLKQGLFDAHTAPTALRRPVLTHLNADTTWLLSIPYPADARRPPLRSRFNVLIDPWLRGPQIDYAGLFSRQEHAIRSSVQHIHEIEALLQQAEAAELSRIEDDNGVAEKAATSPSLIDVVVVSHEFTDHCHRNTLLELHRDVPVFATSKAAKLIRSWEHFITVVDMATFSPGIDWRTTCTFPLPTWLGVSRLQTENDALYYHSAVLVCVGQPDAGAEVVIYTPHGVEASTLSQLARADPPVTTLAFLHGLHDVSLRWTKQLNLGAMNALKAQRLIRSKYWVGTHDEVKKGGGIVARFLNRKSYTLQDALAYEATHLPRDQTAAAQWLQSSAAFVDLKNGQSLRLE